MARRQWVKVESTEDGRLVVTGNTEWTTLVALLQSGSHFLINNAGTPAKEIASEPNSAPTTARETRFPAFAGRPVA